MLLLVEAAIKSVEQLNEINRINNELSDAYSDLEKAYLDMVETLRFTVEAKDPYTRGHSDRVSAYSVLIGQHLGLSDSDINTLKLVAYFMISAK